MWCAVSHFIATDLAESHPASGRFAAVQDLTPDSCAWARAAALSGRCASSGLHRLRGRSGRPGWRRAALRLRLRGVGHKEATTVQLAEWHAWWRRRGGAELRAILMQHWDPIGVAGVPEAADEYDGYVGSVGRMLREGASADDVAAYLADARHGRIGLGRSTVSRRERAAAARAVRWYEEAMRE